MSGRKQEPGAVLRFFFFFSLDYLDNDKIENRIERTGALFCLVIPL